MKATGIVRRIDNLGRIVIPKEVRKSLRIFENDMVEIYTENDRIILKKFSSLSSISNYIQSILDIVNSIYNCDIFVTDSSKIISYSGSNKKKYINQELSSFLLECLKNKKQVIENEVKELAIVKSGEVVTTNYLIIPVITYGDIYGLLTFTNFKNINNILEIGNIIAKILETQVDSD